MNFVAHLEVARRSAAAARDSELLGAMLPDLVSATSLRFGPLEHWPAQVAAGIECHRRADEVFHADRRFVGGIAAIRTDLMESGWARGPARAAAHVSWELLLDATLLENPATREAYLRALATPASEWAPDDSVHDPAAWRQVVDRYRIHGLPGSVDIPTTARRVVGLLERRPRLAVDTSAARGLAEVLQAHWPTVMHSSQSVIEATVTAINDPTKVVRYPMGV